MIIRTLFLTAIFSLLSMPAFAQGDWSTSLPTETVSTYLSGEGLKVIVVPAGADDSTAAAGALRKSLSGASNVALVMDSASLGDVKSLEDRAIVGKVENLPIDLVGIVRVFAGDGGSTAVVTFYAKDGAAHSAFTVSEGKTLEPNEAASAPLAGEGVSTAASTAVASSTSTSTKSREEAIDEFERRFVWFQDWVTYSGETGAYMGSYAVPLKGKYREPLEGAEFYDAIDRPDLADQYRKNARFKTATGIPAAFLYLGGIGLGTWGLVRGITNAQDREEYNDVTGEFEVVEEGCFTCGNWPLWTGIGMFGGAIVLSIVNGTVDLWPTEPPESRRLADEFNKKLAKELGLTDMGNRDSLPIQDAEPQTWRLDIDVSPAGAGMRLQF